MTEKNRSKADTGPLEVDSPIINSPFYGPRFHWQIEKGARPVKAEGRRPASYYFRVPEHAQRGRKSGKSRTICWAMPKWASRKSSHWSICCASGSPPGVRASSPGAPTTVPRQ